MTICYPWKLYAKEKIRVYVKQSKYQWINERSMWICFIYFESHLQCESLLIILTPVMILCRYTNNHFPWASMGIVYGTPHTSDLRLSANSPGLRFDPPPGSIKALIKTPWSVQQSKYRQHNSTRYNDILVNPTGEWRVGVEVAEGGCHFYDTLTLS